MVHELHKRGYQRLRVMPGTSPSGTSWRCNVTPASNVLRTHGAMARDFSVLTAHYTSGMENAYFGWEDARTDTARMLADKFVVRYPEIAGAASGRDWAYVGWYAEMLGIAEQGYLPVAYADWWEPPPPGLLPTMPQYPRGLTMPPGGEAEPVAGGSWPSDRQSRREKRTQSSPALVPGLSEDHGTTVDLCRGIGRGE